MMATIEVRRLGFFKWEAVARLKYGAATLGPFWSKAKALRKLREIVRD